jgi:hypothetical protein
LQLAKKELRVQISQSIRKDHSYTQKKNINPHNNKSVCVRDEWWFDNHLTKISYRYTLTEHEIKQYFEINSTGQCLQMLCICGIYATPNENLIYEVLFTRLMEDELYQ